jgi:hypothetical protein
MKIVLSAAVLLTSAISQQLHAQAVTVLVSNSNAISPVPGLNSTATYSGAALSNDGSSVRAAMSLISGFSRPWVYRNGSFSQHVEYGVTTANGPNRTGPEASHVFSSFSTEVDLGSATAFMATAGAPSSSGNPLGVWIWNGSFNTEIFRLGVDNALGPNLGPNWRFGAPGTNYFNLLQLADGSVLFDTQLLDASTGRAGIVQHRPGTGNAACMVTGNSSSALGPNVPEPTAVFSGPVTSYFPVTFDQRVFVTTRSTATPTREGIWRICNGAPSAIALTGATGGLGPGTSVSGQFDTIRTSARPIGRNAVVFAASYRADTNATLADGIFRQENGSNQLIVAEGIANGSLGANYQNAVFNELSGNFLNFASAGSNLVFETTARRPDNSEVSGLWLKRDGAASEPLLIEGVALAANQTLSRIDQWTVFANGDVVANLSVATNGQSRSVLYLIRAGRAPQVLLAPGQTIAVPTPSGLQNASISSMGLTTDGLSSQSSSSHWAGYDSWAGSNGHVLINAGLNLNGSSISTLILLQASDQERIFHDGFE